MRPMRPRGVGVGNVSLLSDDSWGFSRYPPEMQDWWREVYRRFDPWRPAEIAWRVDRPHSPAARIAAQIATGVGPLRYVLLGTPGSGKSTELKALAEQARNHHLVVAHDVGTHFHETLRDDAALQRVRPWEVLFLLGLAVFRAGEETFDVHFPEALCQRFEQAAVRALVPPGGGGSGASVPTLSVVKLAKTVAVLAGGAVGGAATAKAIESLVAAGDAEWTVPLGKADRTLTDQDAPVQELLASVNALVQHLQKEKGPLLLVTDGLDRVDVLETNQWLFQRSRVLGRLEASTVFAGHLSLHLRGLVATLHGFHPSQLANIQVIDPHEPTRPGSELGFLIEVWNRRIEDLPGGEDPPIQPAELERLARYSGGLLRDFAHLVQGVAMDVLIHRSDRADAASIDRAIEERRRVREEPWSVRHARVLRDVQGCRTLPDLSAEADGPEFLDQLVDSFQLLPYPNESMWWYPHPLLTLNRLPTG